jgi:alkylation response protein AidB-like acyl-CoA dehydrogenase
MFLLKIDFRAGGLGLSNFEGCLITEEMTYACSGIGTVLESNCLAVSLVSNDLKAIIKRYSVINSKLQ